MNCSNCGSLNDDGAKFCNECGQPLALLCPTCGASNRPGARFCNECGTAFGGSAPARQPTVAAALAASPAPLGVAPAAERRLVSVLFADLTGFTPFAEERDAEEVRETLSRYFELATDVVTRYGGTIEKFIGDAVMAVWGAPRALEDDAERAVRAAMELVEAVPTLGEGIQARAGVLTGEAAVTIGAINQGMVAGDLVNTASRLQSVAPPGSVLVGEATYRSASGAIVFAAAGDQVLKGKQAPVPAWQALRVVAEVGGRNRSEGLEAPFVGRAEEMRLLKDLFHTTGREKRLRVVSVVGPAGIGKSRLAWEFSKYLDGVIEVAYWHTGRSPAYGEGITFWALGEMVRERCGLRELDDEATTRTKVAEAVATWVPDNTEREWIERALLTLLGLEHEMAADQLFGAWRTFFERIAEQGTVCLVFEDMHFADSGLLDFVDHLLDWSRGLPIYVVTLARPELIDRRPSWGAGKRNFVSMYLEPLGEADMRELLAGLVPGLPDSAVRTIVARADGIPLYAVETVRALVADGRLVEQDGVYAPMGDLSSLSVPETLTALIASRLDTLDEADRRVVQDAAVLGQSFAVGALAAVAGIPEVELEPRLALLVRRELLQREMDARSPERGQYAFVQALIREVAYNTLAKRDRKKLHLSAARYFESLGSDELAGALASHYLAAHENSTEGPEAEALAGQARIALKAAAQRATSLGAFAEAVSFSQQALSVTADPAEQVALLQQAAVAARTAGYLRQAEQLLTRALEVTRELGDRVAVARATAALGDIMTTEFRAEEAMALLEPAVAEFVDVDDAVRGELLASMARITNFTGDPRRSLEFMDPALELLEKSDSVMLVARALITKSNALAGLGRKREALALAKGGVEIAATERLASVHLRGMVTLAGHLTEIDLSEALDVVRELLALARRTGHRDSVLSAVGSLGYLGFLAGEWEWANEEMDASLAEELSPRDRLNILNNSLIMRAARGDDISGGLAEMQRIGVDMSGAQWQMFVADPEANAAVASGKFDVAKTRFTAIAETERSQAPEYFYRAAHAAIWEGEAESARDLLARCEAAGGFGPIVAARHACIRGGLAALEGRSVDALALYRQSLRGWRTANAKWDEALTGLDMALLLDPATPEVAAEAQSARTILVGLGAQPYIERLDAALARGAQPVTERERAATPIAEAEPAA